MKIMPWQWEDIVKVARYKRHGVMRVSGALPSFSPVFLVEIKAGDCFSFAPLPFYYYACYLYT
jgi:hypothetical protein